MESTMSNQAVRIMAIIGDLLSHANVQKYIVAFQKFSGETNATKFIRVEQFIQHPQYAYVDYYEIPQLA